MANICENKFYISSDNKAEFDNVIKCINDLFENTLYGEITFYDDNCAEGFFESRWTFPYELFEDFLKEHNEESDIYFRCLSEEYGMGYVAMNIYNKGTWSEQQFEL